MIRGYLAVPSRALLVGTVLVGAVLAGCSGDAEREPDASPADTMADAKKILDRTSGVRIDLETEELPEGVNGVLAATGIGAREPDEAFDGTLKVSFLGSTFDVPVISVADTVYAQVPLTVGWSDIDPADYGAPDPATLISPDAGFSSLLTGTDGLKRGETVRGGTDNDEILTEYTGRVDGDLVQNIIPSASGSFDVAYRVTESSELRSMTLDGVFYPDSDSTSYTVEFTDYGTEKEIVAP
ncbi:MAG: LppX_LprAFG lipoprotein [Nocardioides sp.]